jgi:hypothetical protein
MDRTAAIDILLILVMAATVLVAVSFVYLWHERPIRSRQDNALLLGLYGIGLIDCLVVLGALLSEVL